MGIERSYSELIAIPTIEERFDYLKLDGVVGDMLFNGERIFNQQFYRSFEWKQARRNAIIRDLGHELAMPDEDWAIAGVIYVHHINPITIDDLKHHSHRLLDPENLICCSFDVHQAITYGLPFPQPTVIVERKPNDQCPWRINGLEGAKIQNGTL